jgi:hypothetical protein
MQLYPDKAEQLERHHTLDQPRTMRDLEALPQEEATRIWEALTSEQQVRLANAMSAEEIAAMPATLREPLRAMSAKTLDSALNELEAARTTDSTFIFTGEGESFELTEEYCTKQLSYLSRKFEGETEESLGFYAYHNLRLWIEAYEVLMNEHRKRKESK